MNTAEMIDNLRAEFAILQNRLVVDDEAMAHMMEIYYIAFAGWYDPDSTAHEEVSKKLWPHISALNDKFKFKR